MALPAIAPYAPPTQAELPKARGPWQPRRDRLALLVHDMQRYFCRIYPQDAPLAPVVGNIARLIHAARAAGVPVFYTAQKGDQFRPDRGLQADLWGPGMQAVPEHEQILPELAPASGDIVLVKHRYSAFQRSNLEHLMRARGRDQLMICGIYAHIGCLATAAEAFQRDIEAFAVADAQADFSREKHDLAMEWIAATCGVPLSSRQALDALAASKAQSCA
ncbi:isochorismatase family protein [Paracoccus thiocyanatus]|uniref:2,3-dihydro-2,3-dihydroxybenzoate synthetase n=1 Tax=Paracoccus thiocyanatus TaxID=34006 RepID=A0A3D8PCG1_9RHOB|nr:isochorismatase family protein [Paracoccus thiocyanatus]RDW13753.1 2,3-dihydro-2,3-dihydroxybenzoate synthetase [Paracoccus thiocyanatus]